MGFGLLILDSIVERFKNAKLSFASISVHSSVLGCSTSIGGDPWLNSKVDGFVHSDIFPELLNYSVSSLFIPSE